MKLHQYLPALFLQASMHPTIRIVSNPVELPKPRPVGMADDELRKPLLIGRRGKGTRKQRKARD